VHYYFMLACLTLAWSNRNMTGLSGLVLKGDMET